MRPHHTPVWSFAHSGARATHAPFTHFLSAVQQVVPHRAWPSAHTVGVVTATHASPLLPSVQRCELVQHAPPHGDALAAQALHAGVPAVLHTEPAVQQVVPHATVPAAHSGGRATHALLVHFWAAVQHAGPHSWLPGAVHTHVPCRHVPLLAQHCLVPQGFWPAGQVRAAARWWWCVWGGGCVRHAAASGATARGSSLSHSRRLRHARNRPSPTPFSRRRASGARACGAAPTTTVLLRARPRKQVRAVWPRAPCALKQMATRCDQAHLAARSARRAASTTGGGGAIAARRASCARGRATRVRRPCVQGASVYRVREGRTTLQALRPRQPAWTPSHKLRGGEVTTRKLVLCGWGCVVIRHPVYVAGGQRSKHPGHWHCCCASRARQRRASGGLRAPRNARTPPHPARRSRVSRVTPPPPLLPYWCGGSGGGLGGCACGAERGRDDMRLPPLRAPFCRSLPRHPSRPPPSSLRVC